MGILSYSSSLGSGLTDLLMAEDLQPGSVPSYQLCKTIFASHPLGKKIVDTPIAMAQSQGREITIPAGPEEIIREAFAREWKKMRSDKHIAHHAGTARTYGMGALAIVVDGEDVSQPLDFKKLWTKSDVGLNVLDPLNTSGTNNTSTSLDPNSITFQQSGQVVVQGKAYHPSRVCVLYNEEPLYLAYTQSAFGFVGRSAYQRALYPLKTFVQTMRTDDLVVRKSGVIIAKIKQVGSALDGLMAKITGSKRALAREAATEDVLSIGAEDDIMSMNMQNLEGPYTLARKNVIENVALACDMPAKILNSETFAEGFGEGTEDAKHVARYIDGVRVDIQPSYDFMDRIVQYRAWTPAFYETIQAQFPEEYGDVTHEEAFYKWSNSFNAAWPSLLTEPDSEKAKTEDVRSKALIAILQVLMPILDPENRAKLLEWAQDNLNEFKLLFPIPMMLDTEAFANYVPPQPVAGAGAGADGAETAPGAPKPFAAADSLPTLGDRDRPN